MVFLGGPRQVGKTTLARSLIEGETAAYRGRYLNWDRVADQEIIRREEWSDEDTLLVLDEIHKFPKWKNLVKGYYDVLKSTHKFLITGSARLDLYRRGGDSLLGRYHYWRLHPFTLNELPPKISPQDGYHRLLRVGGFPEPFLDNDPREARRWREERYLRIVRDDIRDLDPIRNIQQMSMLLHLLRTRVGGLIQIANLAADVQVAPATVKHWIEIFEKMYLVFVVRAYVGKLPRATQKPFKVYFFDNSDVIGDEGAVFENLVATHLLKLCHFRQDHSGENWDLRFVRDKEQHEVDFVVLRDGRIVDLVEAKWSDNALSPSLLYFGNKLKAPQITQLVGELARPFHKGRHRVVHPIDYFSKEAFPA